MRTSRTFPTLLALALTLLTLVLAPTASRAGEDDKRHEVRWVQRSPVQVLGGSYLGIQAIDITPELRGHFGAPEDAGLLVGKVMEGSPAETAGLRVGDVVTAIDGKDVSTYGELVGELSRHDDGVTVVVETWREGRRLELSAKLEKQDLPRLLTLGKGVHFLPKAQLEGLDADSFAHHNEALAEILASREWRKSLETLEDHRGGLLERLQEMEERLQEMEKRLAAVSDE